MSCYTCHSELRADAAYCPYCGARQPDVPECDDYLYSAFISYRHRLRDEEVAQQVQKAIETYVLPKSVAEFYGAPKLQRVFRDADELPTTGSLPDSITEALAKSRALIVVCSPDTPDSRWVQREIDYFASIHGRGKIHLVLADGTSSESIPPALLKRLEVGDDGVVEERDTEPLAADFRPAAVKRARQEKLRVIAALVGCSFDDLAQREQVRRRKLTGIAAGILAVLLIIGAFLVHSALSSQQAADLSEVKRSVDYAHQLYSEGDRYGAITEALRAADKLPLGADEEIVDSVKEELEEVLFVKGDYSSVWYPACSVTCESGIGAVYAGRSSGVTEANDSKVVQGAIVVSETEGWFAFSGNDREIRVYDLATGKMRAICEMPSEESLDAGSATLFRDLYDANGSLLVNDFYFNEQGSWGSIACFDVKGGECKWGYGAVKAIAGIALDSEGQYLEAVQADTFTTMRAIAIDLETGAPSQDSELTDLPQVHSTMPVGVVGSHPHEFYFAYDGTLYKGSIADKNYQSTPLPYQKITSMHYQSGTVVVTSEEDEVDKAHPFIIQAFDEELNEVWRYEGSYETTRGRSFDYDSVVVGSPVVAGSLTLQGGGEGIVVSVGQWVIILDMGNGNELYKKEMEDSIVGIYVGNDPENELDMIFVAGSGRRVSTLFPFAGESVSRTKENYLKLDTNQNMRWAAFGAFNKRLNVVALSAEDDKDIFAFSTDFSYYEPEKDDYTLDELKAMAHEKLKEDGYE